MIFEGIIATRVYGPVFRVKEPGECTRAYYIRRMISALFSSENENAREARWANCFGVQSAWSRCVV